MILKLPLGISSFTLALVLLIVAVATTLPLRLFQQDSYPGNDNQHKPSQ